MQCVKNFQAPCVACGDCRPPRGEAPCRCEDCGAALTKQACFAFSDFADWHFFCERCAARHFFHCPEEALGDGGMVGGYAGGYAGGLSCQERLRPAPVA